MNSHLRNLVLALGGPALLLGCWAGGLVGSSWSSPPVLTRLPSPPNQAMVSSRPVHRASATRVDPQLVQAQTEFGLALFAALRNESPQENVLMSPVSIAIALAMAYNGTAGTTQAAMAEALRVQGIDLEPLNHANRTLQESLVNQDPEVELAIANSLWVNQDLPVYPEFITAMQATYGAEVATLDFTQPAAVQRINRWASQQTRDRIPTIVDSIPPDQLLFLINAVYFKGAWSQAFDPNLTTERPFTLADGTEIQPPSMRQQGEYRYLETDQFQAISLPYGNGSLSFDVILPAEGRNLEALYQQLTPANWQLWISQMRPRPGLVQLPRFQFTYEADLIPALKSLGMAIAFSDQADFSRLTSLEAAINQVRHKTFIEVTEVGTEAAAVTSIGIAPTSVPAQPVEPFEMVVDRPFLIAIRDQTTGTLLFLGSVVDPR